MLLLSVLQYAENAAEIVEVIKGWMPSGSYLAITIGTHADVPEDEQAPINEIYQRATSHLHMRSRTEIEALFDGLELLEPVTEPSLWRNPQGVGSPGAKLLGTVARKP